MPSPEKTLKLLLRLSSMVLMSAIFASFMPTAWMEAIHRAMGMGELPRAPIVEYLTRSISALYATKGVLLFFLAGDVRRYLPLVKIVGLFGILFGAGMLALDLSVGMPWPWIFGEGPFIIALYGIVLALALRVEEKG